MSGRRNAANRIRGPQSALTDFLASNNISAAQIRADYEARRQQATQQNGQNDPGDQQDQESDVNEGVGDDDDGNAQTETIAQERKRKRQTKAALEKIKKSKAFQRRKAGLASEPGEDDDDEIAFDMYKSSRPGPGQLSNCDICSKRFTVTPYSKEGPNGGLLCQKCSKEAKDNEKKANKRKKPAVKGSNRRQNMSDLLDGKVRSGPKTLIDLCLEKVADANNDIDDFGDLPEKLIDRLCMIFSKRRIMDSRTVDLFVRPGRKKVTIYDAAELETSDYARIFAIAPKLKHFKATNSGQVKDQTIDYLVDRNVQLETLQLEASNLVNDVAWQKLFVFLGQNLKHLKIALMDVSFTDETVEVLANNCLELNRLKLRDCWKLGSASIQSIANLKHLEHLSLKFMNEIPEDTLGSLISSVGGNLQTLSLERFGVAGDSVLALIHEHCRNIKKFRWTHNDYATDAAYAELFHEWANPPLIYADINSCRDIDNTNPDGPEQPVGLASDGFKALMAHSGEKLEYLRINSCRHISHQALSYVFDGKKIYPELAEIDLSLIPVVDDTIVTGIFKSCPNLKKLIVFACFGVRHVQIPWGVALIGTPNAQEMIAQGVGGPLRL